jgi:hypothetical protein
MTEPLDYRTPLPFARVDDATDVAHLKTLAICDYVWGGLLLLFGTCPVAHLIVGILIVSSPGVIGSPGPSGPPPDLGWLFIVFASLAIILGWTIGLCTICSGRCIHRQRHRFFSFIIAGVNCLQIPLGATLGVFTFIVLNRPSVKAMYNQSSLALAR